MNTRQDRIRIGKAHDTSQIELGGRNPRPASDDRLGVVRAIEFSCPSCGALLAAYGLRLLCPNKRCPSNRVKDGCYRLDPTTGILHLMPVGLETELVDSTIDTIRSRARRYLNDVKLSRLTRNGVSEFSAGDYETLRRDIGASRRMAGDYYHHVVDPFFGNDSALQHQRYEELLVTSVIRQSVDSGRDVVLIEMGCGPGRYLIRYGTNIVSSGPQNPPLDLFLQRVRNKWTVEDSAPPMFGYDELLARRLKLIIGVDFEIRMLQDAVAQLRAVGLGDLVGSRILPLWGVGQLLKFSFKPPLDSAKRVALIAFQTLGNQSSHKLRLSLLKALRNLVLPDGTLLVSVNNATAWEDPVVGAGRFYGTDVSSTVGEILAGPEYDARILVTDRGVYSKWFEPNELRALFEDAGMEPTILGGDERSYRSMGCDGPVPLVRNQTYLPESVQRPIRRKILFVRVDLTGKSSAYRS